MTRISVLKMEPGMTVLLRSIPDRALVVSKIGPQNARGRFFVDFTDGTRAYCAVGGSVIQVM